MKAATITGQCQAKRGAREKRIKAKRTRILTSRQQLGVREVGREEGSFGLDIMSVRREGETRSALVVSPARHSNIL